MLGIVTDIKKKTSAYFDSDIISSRQILSIYLPLAAEQLFFSVVGLISTWLLSGEGEAAMSAVSMINTSNQLFIQVCIAFGVGATVVVAQYTGAGNTRLATRTLQQAIYVSVILGLVMAASLVSAKQPIVGFFLAGAPIEVIELAVIYFTGVSLSLPFLAVNQVFSGSMRGRGQTRIALTLSVVLSCLEILFSAVLVLYMKMGVLGVTAAIVASRILGSCFVAFYLHRHNKDFCLEPADFLLPVPSILKGLVIISVPVALEQVFFSSGKALTQRFIASYGTAHMTANAVSAIIQGIAMVPSAAVSSAVMTVVGMSIGMGRVDLARSYTRKFMRTGSVLMALIIIPIIPITMLANHAYHLSPEVARLSNLTLTIYFAGSPFLYGGNFVAPNALRSGGDAVYTSIVSMGCMWCARVLLAYFFSRILTWGVLGFATAMMLEWIVRSAFFIARLNGDKWYRHNVIVKE